MKLQLVNFNRSLQELRKKNNLSKEELAEKINGKANNF